MPIQWSQENSVNVKELDDQHKHFIEILNNMYESIAKVSGREELEKILNDLIAYAGIHFNTEEKYFDKFDYKNASEHKQEHNKLKEKIINFQKDFEANKKDITVDLVDFLEDWLVDHLDIQDKKYTECFNEHGLY